MQEESDLLEEARKGSEEAFCGLVRLHQGRVRAYLSAYARDSDVADDLAQEVFLTAYRSLPTYKGDAPLGVWLLGIARHRVLRYLRDEARRRARESRKAAALVAEFQTERAAAEGDRERPEALDRELQALKECLSALTASGAQIVREHYFQGRPLAALARATGRNESTLRVTLMRLRAALRRCVQGKLTPEGA
ncbi:MAG TPA: sigma-70 family RNA polymerase sigma factor [Planctomycetota bacterium]|nr:sigma-70 family RNA polymerase sigma factor [Planctomycetota bacterium]